MQYKKLEKTKKEFCYPLVASDYWKSIQIPAEILEKYNDDDDKQQEGTCFLIYFTSAEHCPIHYFT